MFADWNVFTCAGNAWARLHCLAGALKWLKREQLLKLLKSRTRQSPAAAATAWSAMLRSAFKPRTPQRAALPSRASAEPTRLLRGCADRLLAVRRVTTDRSRRPAVEHAFRRRAR